MATAVQAQQARGHCRVSSGQARPPHTHPGENSLVKTTGTFVVASKLSHSSCTGPDFHVTCKTNSIIWC